MGSHKKSGALRRKLLFLYTLPLKAFISFLPGLGRKQTCPDSTVPSLFPEHCEMKPDLAARQNKR